MITKEVTITFRISLTALHVTRARARTRTRNATLRRPRRVSREFRDVVFEDEGFDNNSLLTLKNRRCADFAPNADMVEEFRK